MFGFLVGLVVFCEASWAAAFPAITVSISFCWFCVFYAASFSNCNHFPQMDALKIGSFKMFQRFCILQKVIQNISPQKLGKKNIFGVKIHTCFWTQKNWSQHGWELTSTGVSQVWGQVGMSSVPGMSRERVLPFWFSRKAYFLLESSRTMNGPTQSHEGSKLWEVQFPICPLQHLAVSSGEASVPLAMACSCLILAALFFGSVSLLLLGLQFPGDLEISNGLVPRLKYVGFKKQEKTAKVWEWFIGSLFIGPRFWSFWLVSAFTDSRDHWGDNKVRFGCYKRI